jgi:hypothetical protein
MVNFINDSIGITDFSAFATLEVIIGNLKKYGLLKVLKRHELLYEFYLRMGELPEIKSYLNNNPD